MSVYAAPSSRARVEEPAQPWAKLAAARVMSTPRRALWKRVAAMEASVVGHIWRARETPEIPWPPATLALPEGAPQGSGQKKSVYVDRFSGA